ncbi:SigE family RNA polymerase sigma factor [Streptacidiphilus sp. PAMC 29251]
MNSSAEGEFEAFVATRGPRLLRLARSLTGDVHHAEDLLQTVLTKVWPHWRRIAPDSPEAYVRAALVNTHVSWLRRRWRSELPVETLPERAVTADPFAGVDLRQALAEEMRRLSPRQREVVALRYFEDLSVEETAEALGWKKGTVKSQAHRARNSLRAQLSAAEQMTGDEPRDN